MFTLSNKVLVTALSTAIGITSAHAAGNGNTPNGKPFVAINNQIVEVEGAISSLQDQIDLLVARVDTVEQRVTANENAITELQAQNDALDLLVQQNLSDIASIEVQISLLQQANADLQAQITANSGDNIATLQSEVAANSALIATLQSAVLMVQSDIISLESSLQLQIDNNKTLIDALQSEVTQINAKLDFKQNLVNGTCPNGSAIQQILADGSVICGGIAGSSGQLESVTSFKQSASTDGGNSVAVKAFCDTTEGYVATGVGFVGGLGWDIENINTSPHFQNNGNWGQVIAKNNNSYSDTLFSATTCARIIP